MGVWGRLTGWRRNYPTTPQPSMTRPRPNLPRMLLPGKALGFIAGIKRDDNPNSKPVCCNQKFEALCIHVRSVLHLTRHLARKQVSYVQNNAAPIQRIRSQDWSSLVIFVLLSCSSAFMLCYGKPWPKGCFLFSCRSRLSTYYAV